MELQPMDSRAAASQSNHDRCFRMGNRGNGRSGPKARRPQSGGSGGEEEDMSGDHHVCPYCGDDLCERVGGPQRCSNSVTITAIDPGPRQSAIVEYDGERVVSGWIAANDDMLAALRHSIGRELAIEWIECYGMKVGGDVFETCYWVGRFFEALSAAGGNVTRITRRDVKLNLCGSIRAKDANVRQALIDQFPPTGGGKVPQIGTAKQPGPLYGVKTHLWSALAVAVTWVDQH